MAAPTSAGPCSIFFWGRFGASSFLSFLPDAIKPPIESKSQQCLISTVALSLASRRFMFFQTLVVVLDPPRCPQGKNEALYVFQELWFKTCKHNSAQPTHLRAVLKAVTPLLRHVGFVLSRPSQQPPFAASIQVHFWEDCFFA